jgi:hypothetical protein
MVFFIMATCSGVILPVSIFSLLLVWVFDVVACGIHVIPDLVRIPGFHGAHVAPERIAPVADFTRALVGTDIPGALLLRE